LLLLVSREDCPHGSCANARITGQQMTRHSRVRYKVDRRNKFTMNVYDKAPDFTLLDQNANTVRLKDFRDKTVILFFFPKADTPG